MKEQEDQILLHIKQQQEFHKLLKDIIDLKLNRGEYVSTVGSRTFTVYTGAGVALISVDNQPGKNVIHVNGNDITVIDPTISGKQITYHLRHAEKVTAQIANDILSFFVKLD